VDQENEVRIIDLFVGASADVGCMFIAYNLRRILNILDQEIQKHTQRRENYVAKVFHSNPSPPHPKPGLIIEPELFNPCWCFFTNKG
jgi:hypothetical protein